MCFNKQSQCSLCHKKKVQKRNKSPISKVKWLCVRMKQPQFRHHQVLMNFLWCSTFYPVLFYPYRNNHQKSAGRRKTTSQTLSLLGWVDLSQTLFLLVFQIHFKQGPEFACMHEEKCCFYVYMCEQLHRGKLHFPRGPQG